MIFGQQIRCVFLCLALVSLVVGCGGGGSSSDTNSKSSTPPANKAPTADAGADQMVPERSRVTVNGRGTDSDGEIASFSWQQLSGSLVEIQGSDSATLTFDAPELSKSEILTFELLVTDNDGATASDTVAVEIIHQPQVQGLLSYDNVVVTSLGHDYDNVAQQPIRGARVELLDQEQNVISTTYSNDLGGYSFTLPASGEYSVRLVAQLGDVGQANSVEVKDNLTGSDQVRDKALLATYSFDVVPQQEIDRDWPNADFNAQLNWDESSNTYLPGRISPVFALLDQAFEMHTLLQQWRTDYAFEPLYILWNEHNVALDGVWWNGEIANSAFSGGAEHSLLVASDINSDIDEYDRTIIGHELGHYVQINLSRDESIGGSHSLQSPMDSRQAFAEGFASYFSWLLTGSEELINSAGVHGAVTQTAAIFDNPIDEFNQGWFFQGVNADVLRYVTQGHAEFGLAAKGMNFVFDVLNQGMKNSDALISLHSFLGNSVKRDPTISVALHGLAEFKGINSIDEWAIDERSLVPSLSHINELEHLYLPIYRTVLPNEPITVCLNDVVAGSASRLGARAYLKLDIAESGDYELLWQSEQGPAYIWSQNRLGPRYLSGGGLDDNANSLLHGARIATDIPAELYILVVGFYGNIFPGADPRAPRVESGCITLQVDKL